MYMYGTLCVFFFVRLLPTFLTEIEVPPQSNSKSPVTLTVVLPKSRHLDGSIEVFFLDKRQA